MEEVPKEHILLVDDSDENIDILIGIFDDCYEISVAMDGVSALEAAREFPPDLILLDVMMPEMDGYEVCRKLKALPETTEIPVVFVTARDEIEDESLGFELGCVDYITKPITPAIVLARVRTHLELGWARKNLQLKNRQLQETARLREEVESMTRHDLKSPLAGVFTGIDYLLRIGEIDEDQRSTLELMRQSAHKMLAMINASLDVFKMEKGLYRLCPEQIDILPMIRGLTHELHDLTTRKQLSIDVAIARQPNVPPSASCPVKGEQLLCYSMLSNLLMNAIEASPKGSAVTISIHESKDQVVIAIKNPGAVPEQIRQDFFNKFVTAGKKRGTGLGTYSARLMAETMKGTISMTTGPGDTTTVAVTLPR